MLAVPARYCELPSLSSLAAFSATSILEASSHSLLDTVEALLLLLSVASVVFASVVPAAAVVVSVAVVSLLLEKTVQPASPDNANVEQSAIAVILVLSFIVQSPCFFIFPHSL